MVAIKRKVESEKTEPISKKQKAAIPNSFFEDDEEDFDNEEESGSEMDSDGEDMSGAMESGSDVEEFDDDEEMDDDDEDEEEDEEEPSKANSRENGEKGPRKSFIPSQEEVQNMNETLHLFKSNLFKLQIDELVSEVKMDSKKAAPLEASLHKLRSIFDQMKSIPEMTLTEAIAKMSKAGIKIPFPDPQPNQDKINYTFAFQKPAKIHIVGSYLLKSVTKSPEGLTNVDIAVEMPAELLQEKDHMNYRYLYKRAYFLAAIASELQTRSKKKDFPIELEFSAFQNDRRKPILVLKSVHNKGEYDFSSSKMCIRIFPSLPASAFPLNRLAPSRNNVRPHLKGADDADPTPTPHYNNVILSDTVYVAHLNLLHHHTTSCPAFREASMLAKVWIYQRGLQKLGITGFLFSMVMAWLLRGGGGKTEDEFNKRLGNNYSSYQLVKLTMEFIATWDFEKNPIFMTENHEPISEKSDEFSKEAFMKAFNVVMVDMTGRVNLAAHMTKSGLFELQHEARLAMKFFNDPSSDRFDALFLKKVSVEHLKYDRIVKLPPLRNAPGIYTTQAALDFPSHHQYLLHYIPRLLRKGLTDRVKVISVTTTPLESWSINSTPVSHESTMSHIITIGLILNTENALRLVEQGPSADNTAQSEEFRALWGSKAELRRFKDGSILESVVWDVKSNNLSPSVMDREQIVVGMVKYLLERHLGLNSSTSELGMESSHHIVSWGNRMERFLKKHTTSTAPETGFQTVIDAFNNFVKSLKSLEGLPLSIASVVAGGGSEADSFVSGGSDVLRYASVFVPQPFYFDSLLDFQQRSEGLQQPIDIVIQFESSGHWPDDLAAIQKMKVAILLNISDLMKSQVDINVITSVHPYDASKPDIASTSYMDVSIPQNGFTFRCRIQHDRELALINNVLKTKHTSPTEIQQHTIAKEIYESTLVRTIYHSQQIHNLCSMFTFLSSTIRLVKRWVSAHWLSNHIKDELIELICCHVFLESAPHDVPGSSLNGFMRVLELIRKFDWKNEPLVVDLEKMTSSAQEPIGNNPIAKPVAVSLTTEDRGKIQEKFLLARQEMLNSMKADSTKAIASHSTMFVATNRDFESKWWSHKSPSWVILNRLKALANASLNVLKGCYSTGNEEDMKKIFVTPLTDYNAIIHLEPSRCPRYNENLFFDAAYLPKKPKYKNLQMSTKDKIFYPIGFDPVEYYMKELMTEFSHGTQGSGKGAIAFFHDKYGGDRIGVVWNPLVLRPQPWKPSLGYSSLIAESDDAANNKSKKKGKQQGPVKAVPNYDGMVTEIGNMGAGLVINVESL